MRFKVWSQIFQPTQFTLEADWVTGGQVRLFEIGILVMNQPARNKQGHPGEPSLWVDESADDALPLLEDALRGDEPSLWADEHLDEVRSLREENARLRGLLITSTSAIGRFCCKSRLREATKRDSVVLRRIAARSIRDGRSEEWPRSTVLRVSS
jgi:hypothetical protein